MSCYLGKLSDSFILRSNFKSILNKLSTNFGLFNATRQAANLENLTKYPVPCPLQNLYQILATTIIVGNKS